MSNYRICTKSVMDTIADPDISFDEDGVCNYYYDYQAKVPQRLFHDDPAQIERIVEEIRKKGRGKDYDCLIGISGGVDSTYVAYLVKSFGLRPLAMHFDNGWNSELAIKNIENTLRKLNIDLFTHVIDWEEFKSLQLAFLHASTPDGEIPTDHAIFALLFGIANKHNIKYIINGNNFSTEFVMPQTWSYGHIDWKYIRYINSRFGTRSLPTYPNITLSKYLYYFSIKRIRILSILNYLPYDKMAAMDLLKKELDWKYYGGKHYESIYTRFYQGFILPRKFGIDKRKAHLSTLIFSGQITREQALEELAKPVYPEGMLEEDKTFVLKKLDLSQEAFDSIMKAPTKTYRDYPNQSAMLGLLKSQLNKLRERRILHS